MSLVDTLMQPLRMKYNTQVDKHEIRGSRYGAYDVFRKQTDGANSIVTPEVRANVASSMGKTVVMPVLDAQDVTLGNVRSCVVQDSENKSSLIQLTFATIAFGFTMTPSQHWNNDISYEADFQRKMMKYLNKLAAHLDTLCIDKANAIKNTVWDPQIANIYATTGNALQVPQSEAHDFYNQLPAIFELLDFYDAPYDVIANTLHTPDLRRLAAQGGGNSVNESFQFDGTFNYNMSNRVLSRSGVQSTVYAMPQGTVAFLNRNDPDAIAGHSVGDHKVWGQTTLPIVDLNVGTYYTKDCSDRNLLHSGTAHLTRTLLEGFEFSTDICLMSSYNSDPLTRSNPTLKGEIWQSDTAPV